MKKIVIAGTSVYGIGNLGDEALLKVLVDNLRAQYDDIDITLLARHPGSYVDSYFGVRSIENLEFPCKADSLGKWFRGLNPGDDTAHLHAITTELEQANLLIIGGDPFNELSMGFGWGLMPHASLLVTLAKFLQVPAVLYAIHMGRPIESQIGLEMTKYCIENCKSVTLREPFSEKVLANMGVATSNCVVLSDPAFGLEPVRDMTEGARLLNRYGISLGSKKLIGVNFRHQYWNWEKPLWDTYRKIVADVCDHLVEKYDAEILFIPNSHYDTDSSVQLYQDDRPANRDIAELMQYSQRAHLIEDQLNLTETLALFPHLDAHISSRRHSLTFAATHGVPIVGIGAGGPWHIAPAMEELDVADMFLELEELSVESLAEKVELAVEHGREIVERLENRIPELREKARAHANVLLSAML